MRFLVMVKPNAAEIPRYEAGQFPESFPESLDRMGKFNETLTNDGMLVDMGGLQPTSHAVRIDYSGAKPIITDGPFAETKEQLAGYFLIEAKNLDEALKIASRIPSAALGGSIEVRPVVMRTVEAAVS